MVSATNKKKQGQAGASETEWTRLLTDAVVGRTKCKAATNEGQQLSLARQSAVRSLLHGEVGTWKWPQGKKGGS